MGVDHHNTQLSMFADIMIIKMKKTIIGGLAILCLVGIVIANLGLTPTRNETINLNSSDKVTLENHNLISENLTYIEYLDTDDCMVHIQDTGINSKEYFQCSNMTTKQKQDLAKEIVTRRLKNIADAYQQRDARGNQTPSDIVGISINEK